jgi:photosystem II Psb27 protein
LGLTYGVENMSLKPYISRLLALVLVLVIGLMGSSGLTGNYGQDTLTVIESLTTALDLVKDDPNKAAVESQAKEQINDYISLYRRDKKSGGLRSFTTMQTALNSLAGYYTAYGSRPIPDKLKQRLKQEFKQVQFSLQKGI